MLFVTVSAVFWLAQVAAEPAVQTGEPAAAPIEQLVAQWVKQLQTPDQEKSSQAEEALIELGSEALSHLPKVSDDTPERTRIQLRRIRRALSAPANAKGDRVKYSLVGTMTADEAFRSLQQQAGLPVDLLEDYESEMSKAEVNFDVKRKPFWDAIDVLMAKSDLMMSPYSGDSRLFTLIPDPRESAPRIGHVCTDGSFRYEASRLEAVRDFRNPDDRILRFVVMVFWEPRFVPVTLEHSVDQIKIKAGDDVIQLLENRTPREITVRENLASVDLEFPFELPHRSVREIEELTGKIKAILPGRTEEFTFDKLGGQQQLEQEAGGVQVIVERAKTVQNLQDIRILVRLGDVDEAMKTHLSWVYNNIAYLSNAKGQRFEDVLTEIYQQDDGEIRVLYKYDAPGAVSDYSFHYETPTGFTTVSSTYTLKNIELP